MSAQMTEFQSLFLWNSLPESSTISSISLSMSRFNPCFCGTRSRRRLRKHRSIAALRFQSLFLWNSLPEPTPCTTTIEHVSFNPCFCGTRSRSTGCAHRHKNLTEFQSLFLWNSLPEFIRYLICCWWSGFNPCFCGTRSRSLSYWQRAASGGLCFNPCFCGTRSRSMTTPHIQTRTSVFQSLFLWNSLPEDGVHPCER